MQAAKDNSLYVTVNDKLTTFLNYNIATTTTANICILGMVCG